MPRNSIKSQAERQPHPSREFELPGLAARRAITLVLLFHLAAVVVAPFAVEPSSNLAGRLWLWFRPYLDATYLNHGYHFFAPEPGPSHLIRYEVRRLDGTAEEGLIPDRQRHRPRLLYHRYFMLSEALAPVDAEHGDHAWKAAFARSYAEHLAEQFGTSDVRLYLIRHAIPYPNQIRSGIRPTDPLLYQEVPLVDLGGETR